jgi:hypothetical protein
MSKLTIHRPYSVLFTVHPEMSSSLVAVTIGGMINGLPHKARYNYGKLPLSNVKKLKKKFK